MNANRVIGIVLIIFSGVVWYLAQQFPEQNVQGPGTAFFPQLMAVILIILALLLIFVNPVTESQKPFSRPQIIVFLLFVGTVTGYILLIPQLGFVVSTLLGTAVMVQLVSKSTIRYRLLTSVLLTAIAYFVFRYLFNVPLPAGLLI